MIIVTGSLAYDYLMEFPGEFGEHILSEHVKNINLSFIVNKFAKRRGGTAGNVSYSLGLLKTPHILFSFAGNDFKEYKNDFQKMGINTTYIVTDKSDHTSTGFGLTDKANNQIWGYYYGAGVKNTTLRLSDVKELIDLVLIGPQGTAGSMNFVKQCIDKHIPYMFDPGFILTQVNNNDLELGIKHAAITIGNEYEITLIQSRIKKLKENKTIITTLGEKGTMISENGKILNIPSVSIKRVASTTGAGDAWRGGFLAGYQRKLPINECGRLGAVSASFAVEHFGTQEHMFTVSEFKNRYRQAFGTLVQL